MEKTKSPRAYFIASILLIPKKEGFEYAKKAFEMEPSNTEYAENLAMYYTELLRDEKGAMGVYEKHWAATQRPEGGLFIAEYYFRKKEYEKAMKICKEILVVDPNNKKAKKLIEKINKKLL
jgi:tetratricopeptide (TPR) repeat protein